MDVIPERKMTESDKTVSRKIRELFDEKGDITQAWLGKELGLSQGHIHKLLEGKVPWKVKYLDKVADIFAINRNEIFILEGIPVVAELGAEGFDYSIIDTAPPIAVAPPIPSYSQRELYAIRIKGNDFLPLLRDGITLYCKKNSYPEVKDGDLVVFLGQEGIGWLRQVNILEQHILLKSLNPTSKDFVIPLTARRMLDKVVFLSFV